MAGDRAGGGGGHLDAEVGAERIKRDECGGIAHRDSADRPAATRRLPSADIAPLRFIVSMNSARRKRNADH